MSGRSATLLRTFLLLLLVSSSVVSAAQIRWQFEPEGRVLGKPALGETAVYVAGGSILYALSLDGEELWQLDLEGEVAANLTLQENVLYVHSSLGLHAVDVQGRALWTYESEDLGPLVDGRSWGWGSEILADPWGWYRSAPLVQGDTVIFGSSDGVHAVSRRTGEVLWRVPVGPVTADVVAYEDAVIVAGWNNSLYALDAASGKLRWRFEAQAPSSKGVDWVGYVGCNLTPVVHGERVFVGNRGTYFYALDANDGTEAWSTKVGASWIGSPAVISGDAVYYGLSDGNAVMGHLLSTGAQTLFYQTGSAVFAQPELVGSDLLAGTLTGRLFSIDTVSGEGEEILNLGPEQVAWADFFKPEIVPEGLTRHQGDSWAIDRMLTQANGVLNLTVEGDTAYVGTGAGRFYALDLGQQD